MIGTSRQKPAADPLLRPELPTLLNVEDGDTSRFRRSRVLRAAGYDVVEASTAREALDAAAHKRLAVAVVDVRLPDVDGIALCDTLKRLKPELPVLLVAPGAASPELREAGIAAGAQRYLDDPVDAELLVRHVTDALTSIGRHDEETWVVTDGQGFILHASPLGARLLSATPRGLHQRSLLVFFEQERSAWRDAMILASRGERIFRAGRLRPKERRPIPVRAEISLVESEVHPSLLWTFRVGD